MGMTRRVLTEKQRATMVAEKLVALANAAPDLGASSGPVSLTCECCGFRADFPSAMAAFEASWDCPPYFSQVVVCPLCPATCVIEGGPDHSLAHEKWQREGRPTIFEAPPGM